MVKIDFQIVHNEVPLPTKIGPRRRMDKQMKMTASPDKNTVSSPTDTTASTTDQTISYSAERIIGNGSFGVVFQAAVVETGEVVAIKKVLQDKRFKNRELQIMRQLVKDPHSNIVGLKHCFYSQVSCVEYKLSVPSSIFHFTNF